MTPEPLFDSLPELTPAQLGESTGIKPDMQRDWRRRGYIQGLRTVSGNGRWLYDWYDVFTLSMMQRLYCRGIELSQVKTFAATVRMEVLLWAGYRISPGDPSKLVKYVAFVRTPGAEHTEVGGWVARKLSNPFLVGLPHPEAMIVVDCEALADSLPKTES